MNTLLLCRCFCACVDDISCRLSATHNADVLYGGIFEEHLVLLAEGFVMQGPSLKTGSTWEGWNPWLRSQARGINEFRSVQCLIGIVCNCPLRNWDLVRLQCPWFFRFRNAVDVRIEYYPITDRGASVDMIVHVGLEICRRILAGEEPIKLVFRWWRRHWSIGELGHLNRGLGPELWVYSLYGHGVDTVSTRGK